MTITHLTRTEEAIHTSPERRTLPQCGVCPFPRQATTRVTLRDQDGALRRVFNVCDEHREFCHDERHDTPCPLPCSACADECNQQNEEAN